MLSRKLPIAEKKVLDAVDVIGRGWVEWLKINRKRSDGSRWTNSDISAFFGFSAKSTGYVSRLMSTQSLTIEQHVKLMVAAGVNPLEYWSGHGTR